MTLIILLGWATVATLWAAVATILHYRNPLPVPDKGHRIYGVPDERARQVVVSMLGELSHLQEQFTFDSGPTHQTLMWDGFTVINYVDTNIKRDLGITSTGLSVPVSDPLRAANRAVELLRRAGYSAALLANIDKDLPANYLVPVQSDAFDGWVIVFRRPLLKMPYPKKRKAR